MSHEVPLTVHESEKAPKAAVISSSCSTELYLPEAYQGLDRCVAKQTLC